MGKGKGDGNDQLEYPYAVTTYEKFVIVSDTNNNRVMIWDKSNGVYVRKIGGKGGNDGEFRCPIGVAVIGDELFVADSGNHRIQVFDLRNGQFKRKFDGFGEEDPKSPASSEHFHGPLALAATDNHLFVSVTGRDDYVAVLKATDGKLLMQFGRKGTRDGEFNQVWGLCVNADRILVTDKRNDRVQLFDLRGRFIRKFGKSGSGDGELGWPEGIVVVNKEIHLSDCDNNRICVFNLANGKFVRHYDSSRGSGEGQLKRPSGITVAGNEIIVAELGNHRLSFFK